MGEHSSIEWTHHTFNPWWGCVEVSPACDHCYARTWAIRTGHPDLWGVDAKRRTFGDKHWAQPLRWNRSATAAGKRERVFCASMADVFDNHPEVEIHRLRLWDLIRSTRNLDWLLLTKRIGNAMRMLPKDWGAGWQNVWLGISVGDQPEDIPKLLATPAAVRFLSCEPLLGPLNLCAFNDGFAKYSAMTGAISTHPVTYGPKVDWVIVGGESGPLARAMDLQWARDLVGQCKDAAISCFVKQLGAKPGFMLEDEERRGNVMPSFHHFDQASGLYIKRLNDRKGGDPSEWPAEMRVREFPS